MSNSLFSKLLLSVVFIRYNIFYETKQVETTSPFSTVPKYGSSLKSVGRA